MSDYESGYPEYMAESLAKVAASRAERLGKSYAPIRGAPEGP